MKYGFSDHDVRVSSKQELNKYISDEQIYHHYLGDFTVDEFITSPRGESSPSFKVDIYDGKLMWRDFGIDHRPKDAINLVQFVYQLQGKNLSYFEAMQTVLKDVDSNKKYTIQVDYSPREKPDIRLKYRTDLKDYELSYWRGERIHEDLLRKFFVYSGEIWYNNRCWHYSHYNDPLFIYLFDSSIAYWKGYRPLSSDKSKFIEHNCTGRAQGWELLRSRKQKSKYCIITKSYKDVISYYNISLDAVAPQSETHFLTGEQVAKLKESYKGVFINYDPDQTGLENMKKYSEQYGLPYFHFGNENVKDLTELRKRKDDSYVKRIIINLCKDSIKRYATE